MDQDRDGVITRSEWRGSTQSFDVHDWNRDGVLSGDEVRPGARRQQPWPDDPGDSAAHDSQLSDWTPERFDDLDHNRDGRITRDEWHFDAELFRRVDSDRNGSISRREFLGLGADDDRDDRFSDLDVNGDGRIAGSGVARRSARVRGRSTAMATASSVAWSCSGPTKTTRRRTCSRAWTSIATVV